MKHRMKNNRGFTIVEILVALVLIAALAAVLIPSVIGQANRGEINQVMEDSKAIGDAATMFRMDVKKWPATLVQLNTKPTAGDSHLESGTLSSGQVARWAGPYLETGAISSTGLTTGLGATILNALTTTSWGSGTFLTVQITNVSLNDATSINQLIDGDDVVTATEGRVRFDNSGSGTVSYLTRAIK